MKRLTFSFIAVLMLLASSTYGQKGIENLYDENSEQTIFRQAGNYSADHDVMTIAVLRGVKDREQYDEFILAVGNKLEEKGVPYKFFQRYNDRPGTVFVYFIENDLNGSFDVEEFAAILPHAVQRFKTHYRN